MIYPTCEPTNKLPMTAFIVLSMMLMIASITCRAQSPTNAQFQNDISKGQSSVANSEDAQADAALKRVIDWLSHAVPTWMKEHHCAACHHQGDAARALIKAIEAGELEDLSMLESTIDWCAQPDKWQQQIADPRSNDYRLADIHFSLTLRDVSRLAESHSFEQSRTAGSTVDRSTPAMQPARYRHALEMASEKLAKSQSKDGSWNIDNGGEIGSPITQGSILLTGNAASVLRSSTNAEVRQASERAWKWLCAQRPHNVFEASSLLIALASCRPSESNASSWPQETEEARQACRALILQVEASDSLEDGSKVTRLGFGPYVHSSGENFDTALAILAMLVDDATVHRERIDQAVSYLHHRQQPDGSWDETTRLSDVESYAHRTSTTAWVTQAILQVKLNRRSAIPKQH